MNKNRENIELNKKLIYPIKNKVTFIKDIIELVNKTDLVILNNKWCKWSCPAVKGFFLLSIRIKFIDKNS